MKKTTPEHHDIEYKNMFNAYICVFPVFVFWVLTIFIEDGVCWISVFHNWFNCEITLESVPGTNYF